MGIRCFIAIDIGEELRRKIASFVRGLEEFGPDVRWLRPENLHLTLKFLGDTEETLLDGIASSLQAVASRHGGFGLRLAGTGVFPDYTRPRVVWIGVDKSEELNLLYSDIEREMEGLGYERERREFTPHLTIGRIKSREKPLALLRELRRWKDREFGKIEVSEILLMKSTLKPTGAEYERLASAGLG